jgi:hypothetical protein
MKNKNRTFFPPLSRHKDKEKREEKFRKAELFV